MSNLTSKQRARLFITQALYQKQITNMATEELVAEFLAKKSGKISKAFFITTLTNIAENTVELDNLIIKYIDRELDKLGAVERAILLLGVYELKYSLTVPYKVVINECLNLAELIAAEGSYKLINLVLDRVATDFRINEKDNN